MIKQFNANKARQKRHLRLRSRLTGTQERPRLNIFRSGTHIYAQVIDDSKGLTLASASSLEEELRSFQPEVQATPAVQATEAPAEVEPVAVAAAPAKKGSKTPRGTLPAAPKGEKKTPLEELAAISNNHKVALAREVGKLVAQRAKEKGIEQVVFDRGGYPYHGRVAALAEGAREVGLKF
jgi:large subunit ribosomal protein L18